MPRLHACYGPAPVPSGDWMDVPARWFRAYQVMRPRIEAERALALVSQIAAGAGTMDPQDRKQYIDDLRRTMHGGRLPRAEPVTEASLRLMRIPVETIPAKGGGD